MSDTPDTNQAATCPSCGSDDPNVCCGGATGELYGPHEHGDHFPDPCCLDAFHSAHPVSEDRVWTIELCECNEYPCYQERGGHLKGRPIEVVSLTRFQAAEARAAEAEQRLKNVEGAAELARHWFNNFQRKPAHEGIDVSGAQATLDRLRSALTPKHPQDEEERCQ